MKIKKLLIIAVAALTALALMTGCTNTAVQTSASPSGSADPSADPSASASPTLNLAGAYAMFEPEHVMLTVDGRDVTWQEFFYLINYYIQYVQYYNGSLGEWDAELVDGKTTEEFIRDGAVDWLIYASAINNGAAKLNVTLTEDDRAELDADWAAQVETYGSEEAFLKAIEDNYCTKELYTVLAETQHLADNCFENLYGALGASLTDEEAAEYTKDDGYLMAKHILIKTVTTDADGNNVSLSDDEKAKARATMDDIKAQLDACPAGELDAKFDELMKQYSEDSGGLATYPGGYLFQSGEMTPVFEDTTKALEIGAYSDVVESNYGYHIIYRLPINYDTVPNSYSKYLQGGYDYYTLRYITAVDMFDSVVNGWKESIDVKYGEGFDKLDFKTMFAFG